MSNITLNLTKDQAKYLVFVIGGCTGNGDHEISKALGIEIDQHSYEIFDKLRENNTPWKDDSEDLTFLRNTIGDLWRKLPEKLKEARREAEIVKWENQLEKAKELYERSVENMQYAVSVANDAAKTVDEIQDELKKLKGK